MSMGVLRAAAVLSLGAALGGLLPGCAARSGGDAQVAADPPPPPTSEDVAAVALRWLDARHDIIEVMDPRLGRRVKLALIALNLDSITAATTDTYFVNADFQSPVGHTYSLDLFFSGVDKSDLTFEKADIRSVDGWPRYTWYQEGGVWKQRRVAARPPKLVPGQVRDGE